MKGKKQNTRSDLGEFGPTNFFALARLWCRDQSALLLGYVWAAYDIMQSDRPLVNDADLERSITQLLEPRIREVMSGEEPFYIQHGPYERETMKKAPAQPPQYDLAFVSWADERVMWPIEAKVLKTPGAVSEYVKHIKQQFLNCRYAPFSSEAAMIAYLLSGSPVQALEQIATKVPCILAPHPSFSSRNHRVSAHIRRIPAGKHYRREFLCHHLILSFAGVNRMCDLLRSPEKEGSAEKI